MGHGFVNIAPLALILSFFEIMMPTIIRAITMQYKFVDDNDDGDSEYNIKYDEKMPVIPGKVNSHNDRKMSLYRK